MNLKEIDRLMKDFFGKPVHIELKMSLNEDMYTDEFIKYFRTRLKKKTIALEHLITTKINNNRWIINDDCNLVMLSIPFLDNNIKCIVCLNGDLKGYLSRKDFDTIEMFFFKIKELYNLDMGELYASMLQYNTVNKINKNLESLTNACYKEQEQWYM